MIIALLLAAAPVDAPASTRSLYLQLIHQARSDGRPRAAIAYLDDFDCRYPADSDARALRVNALLDLGDINGAETAAVGIQDAAITGHLLAARDRWAEAAAAYARAVAARPTDPLLRNAHGYALLRAHHFAPSVEALRAAFDLAPGDITIRNNLLLALTLAGQRAEVEAWLRRAADPETLRRQIVAQAAQIQKGR